MMSERESATPLSRRVLGHLVARHEALCATAKVAFEGAQPGSTLWPWYDQRGTKALAEAADVADVLGAIGFGEVLPEMAAARLALVRARQRSIWFHPYDR